MAALSEKRTEDIAKELLEVRGWNSARPPKGNILWKNEYRDYDHLRKAFAGQSKTGSGDGYPDFLIIDPQTKFPLIVGETKAASSDIQRADAEAKHYADALIRLGYHPLAVGIAGNAEQEIAVAVNKLSPTDGWQTIKFRDTPIQWVPTPQETSNLILDDLLFDLYPQIPSEETLAKRADEINRIFRECKIKDEFRPAVIGAFMLGLVRTRGNIRTDTDHVLQDINNACQQTFTNAGKSELAESISVPEANHTLAARAGEIIYILRLLNITTLTAAHDYLGQLYETFFRFTGGNTIGQFFTPRHVSKFVADLCQVSDQDFVIDPTCGTGGFLIACLYRMMGERNYTKDQISKLVASHLFGFESEPITAALCVANMIIRGDGTTSVMLGDCFTDPRFPIAKATVAIGNPPFPHKQTDDPPEKFVDRALESLVPRGQLAMVVPASLLGKSDKTEWRRNVLQHNTLKAVITLPGELFQPYASSTTGIVILERGIPHHQNTQTFFCHIENDGFRIKKSTRVFRKGEQLTLAADCYANHENIPGLCSFNRLTGFVEGSEWAPGAFIAAAEHSSEDIITEVENLTSSFVAFHASHARDLADLASSIASGQLTPHPYQEITSRKPKNSIQPQSVGSLFNVFYGQRSLHNKENLLPGTSLIISSKGPDNGCYGFRDYDNLVAAPFVTVPSTGSIGEANVQLWPCGVTDDCLLLIPKSGATDEDLWIAAATLRLERWRFNYGRKITPDRIAGFVMRRDLPTMEAVRAIVKAAQDCATETVRSLSGRPALISSGEVRTSFESLVKTWKSETALLSNVAAIVLHPAYQQMIGLGKPAIAFMLEALAQEDYSEWFWALRAITREDPISEEDTGDVQKMAEAWLAWGAKTGYRNG